MYVYIVILGFDNAQSFPAYIDELERSLEYIRESPNLTVDEKRRFFRSANTNLGERVLHIFCSFFTSHS